MGTSSFNPRKITGGFTPGKKGVPRKYSTTPDAFSRSTLDKLLADFQYGSTQGKEAEYRTAQQQTQQRIAEKQQAAAAPAPNTIQKAGETVQATADKNPGYTSTGGATNGAIPEGDMWDGFARRYQQGEADMLMSDPSIILHDYLSQGGKTPINIEGDLGRYADNALKRYYLLTGGNMDPKANKTDTIINSMADLYKNLTTVGGRTPTVEDMLAQMYAGFGDKESSLYGEFYDPSTGQPKGTEDQINAVMQYIGLLGDFSNPIYANSLYGQAQRLAQDYKSLVANGKQGKQTYLDYLKANYLK